ncbi:MULTISPECIES: hypothetical protein [Streptomyces]|uniref:hypothetical protein n=1 Tax=Streptomyces TaxID=1883 RepID=UPI000D507AC1|nr:MULTISPECIES: hypothetical protein [unclassified Streptomyces]PVC71787.1 hypothetical protein DBP18_17035 [Streptomyces sp. CS081A]
MTRPLARTVGAVAGAVLLLGACDPGAADAPGAARPTPLFSEPASRQVGLALRHTRETGGADLRQTVTFTSEKGDAVQNLTGRLDFAGSRGEAAHTWRIAPGFPEEARRTILGTLPGRGTGDASGRYAVDTRTIHYRAASAGYWLRYEGDVEPFPGTDSIDHLRGTASPIGGTLLEVLGGVRPAEARELAGGGRSYRADFPLAEALELFPYDLRQEFVPAPLNAGAPGAPVPVAVEVDREGRITRASADLTSLLDKGRDGALTGVTGLRAELALSGFGAPEPPLDTVPGGRVLAGASAVVTLYGARPGDCLDFNTGMRHRRLVVRVPCAGPHDGAIVEQHSLPGTFPGTEEAAERARRACAAAGERGAGGTPWRTWSTEEEWTEHGEGRATCYTVSRAAATPPVRTASASS